MAGYITTGDFNSGAPPGLDAPFFNNIEHWIQQLEGDSGVVSVNGQTSGTAYLFQTLQGTIKRAIVVMSNYRNSSAQNLALPVAFAERAWVSVGETQSMQVLFLLSASAQTVKVVTSLAAAGGNVTPQGFIKSWSIGEVEAGFDAIQMGTGAGAAINGIVIVEGK